VRHRDFRAESMGFKGDGRKNGRSYCGLAIENSSSFATFRAAKCFPKLLRFLFPPPKLPPRRSNRALVQGTR
jgi:hypothetical protein